MYFQVGPGGEAKDKSQLIQPRADRVLMVRTGCKASKAREDSNLQRETYVGILGHCIKEGIAYVSPRLRAAYTRSSLSGCGTLGAGWATENILDTRESTRGFLGGPGGLKTVKLLKKRLPLEGVSKNSPNPHYSSPNPI